MKKVVLALVALFVFTVNGNSQVPQVRQNRQFSKEEMVQRRTDRLAQDLGLNENQKASLLKLNTDFADLTDFLLFGLKGMKSRMFS